MQIDIVTSLDKALWDSFIEKSPYGTIFHTWDFLEIIQKYTGNKLYPLVARKGNMLYAVCPLFIGKKSFMSIALSPPPKALLLYLGPVFCDMSTLKQSKRESISLGFQRKLDHYLKSKQDPGYVRIRTVPGILDSRPFLWSDYSVDPLYTYSTELEGSHESIWMTLNSQTRKDIKKSQRMGLTVREGTKLDLPFVCASVFDRLKEQGLVSANYADYLTAVYDLFYPSNLRVFIAEYEGKSVSGAIFLFYKNTARLWVGIPKVNLPGAYPNDLIIWESMKYSFDNNFFNYEIMDGGIKRLRKYKAKFNLTPKVWFSCEKYGSFKYEWLGRLFKIYRSVRKK